MKLSAPAIFKFLLIGLLLIGISLGIRNLKDASSSMLRIGVVNAQVPPPTTTCSTADPEFHSLRPYPGSTCVTETLPLAKFCGNTLTLQDKIDITYQPGIDNCSPLPDGKVRCSYVKPISETINIDLTNAKLPIMGNTENVPNSQTPTGTPLTDAEKMNGYVSWYLNGVMNRAEDGSSKNTDYNAVNLSGPINKLLPSAISDAQRIKTIDNATAGQNHNQIAVCAKEGSGGFIGNIQDTLGIGKSNPVQCYTGNNTAAQNDVYQLESWNGELSWWNDITNSITDVENALFNLFPLIPHDVIETSVGNHWNRRKPPLPWSDANGEPFASEELYQKAYNEWRGRTCIIIPVVNKVVCVDNIFVPNKYADLYSYIPLSSTEDVMGNIQVDSVSVGGPGITDVTFSNQTPSTLFFPHLVESDQLGSILQDTYLASGETKTGAATAVAPPSSCTTVDVRSNKGDSLFATSLSGNLGYTASFTCDFTAPQPPANCAPDNNCLTPGLSCCSGQSNRDTNCATTQVRCAAASSTPTPSSSCSGSCVSNLFMCNEIGGTKGTGFCTGGRYCCNFPFSPTPTPNCAPDNNCLTPGLSCCSGQSNRDTNCATTQVRCAASTPTPPPVQTCSKTVSIALSTSSNTPKIDDVWSRLVAGPTAVVKRMFPKLGTQIGTLKDIPGSTSVTYTGAQASSAELNFPHVGGISEYFLKGIQTMLRPKGYGEPISFGPTTNNPPSGNVDCDQSAPDITLPNTIGKEALHKLAIQWEGGKEGDHVLECYNDVARKSLAAGISPAFTFLMWINESGGSNYNISNQDLGINSSQITGLTAQLERFLQLPSAYKNNYPQCFGKTKTDTETFFDLFAVGLQAGQCVPGAGQPYIDLFNDGWSWFTTCPMANYPFVSSCY